MLVTAVWKHLSKLRENGILVQGIGIPLRHLLALYGILLVLRGLVGWRTLLLAVALWIVSGLGVTAGAHRLWTHQSYRATPVMEAMLMVMFSIADQGTILGWSLTHAMHHSASDTGQDPHNRQEGFWYAHFGWLYSVKRYRLSNWDYTKVTSGLGRIVQFHDTLCIVWDPFWSLVFPSLVASFWGEAWAGFFVAGAFRWFFVQHVTFFVNSVAHGEREPFESPHAFDVAAKGIGPRVSLLTTVLSLGEGWHDYHHLFPWDYAAAELDAWDQWNPTKVFIDLCGSAGLAEGRRRCSPKLQQARRRQLLAQAQGQPHAGQDACSYTVEGPLFLRRRVMVPARTA